MKGLLKSEIIVSIAIFVVLLVFAFNSETCGDAGDSVGHYLFSHYAFKYPQFFLHHWAKPVFVLLSAPFAQFGFKGLLVFNCLCASLSCLMTYYIARNLELKRPWLVFVFIFCAPLYFKLVLSGLTEYLFGLFLVTGIYLSSRSRNVPAAALVSLLPLVRSEGLLILGVFALFFLIRKNYKPLAFLLLGQIFYSLIGFFYYHDVLWIFTKIPYANMGSPYGHGHMTDFIHRLNYTIEKPLFVLLIVGIAASLYQLARQGFTQANECRVFLVLGSFAAVFVGHALFWWLGIFNSMGLPRVLIAVVPVTAILALQGLNLVSGSLKKPLLQNALLSIIVLTVALYPFTSRPRGVVYNDTLFEVKETKWMDEEVAPYIRRTFPDYASRKLYFSSPYLSLALNIDYFDPTKHREMQYLSVDQIPANAIIIWDDWFSATEGGIGLDFLSRQKALQPVRKFELQDQDRKIQYIIFQYKP